MPEFQFTSPEGKRYTVRGPDGATPEQAFGILQKQLAAPPAGTDAVAAGGQGFGTPGGKPQQPLPMASRIATGAPPTGGGVAQRAQAIREIITGQAGGAPKTGSGQQAFESQQGIEARLRGQGMSDQQIQSNPEWQASARGLNRQVSAADTSTAMGTAAAPFIDPLVSKTVAPIARGIGGLARRVIGTGAGEATEKLTGEALKRASSTAGKYDAAAAAKGEEAARAEQTAAQIGEVQPGVAAGRAEAQAPTIPMEVERQRVVAELRQRARAVEQSYRQAGFGVEEAKRMAQQAERHGQEAEKAVGMLEQEMLAKPGMTAEEFGQRVRTVTKDMSDRLVKLREQQSGFTKAIAEAGDELRVRTTPAQNMIDGYLKGNTSVRNPQLRGVLEQVRALLKTDGHDALSVSSAESARKFLASVQQTKRFGELPVDAETAYVVNQIRKSLVESATSSFKPYRDALAKWRVLSRPLDIVERKGGLAKVLNQDPVSSEYAMTEAEVARHVIAKARAGNPVFARLLQESPEMRDAARLAFTQDLFGKETVPTAASLRTWLKTNEAPLRQLNLFDEFRDLRVSRETAARAVQEAKGARTMTAQQLREAEKAQGAVGDELKRAESLRDKAKARLDQLGRGQATADDLRARSTQRAGEAQKRLGQTAEQAKAARDASLKRADQYRTYLGQLRTARPAEIPTQTRGLVNALRKDGHLNAQQYEKLLAEIKRVEDVVKDTEQARQSMRRIATHAMVAAGGGAAGVYALKHALPGFKDGGSFTVGGDPSQGPDTQVVQFRASPGERVTITPQMSAALSPPSIFSNYATSPGEVYQIGGALGLDPMKMNPNNTYLAMMQAMKDRATKPYGAPEE